MVYPRYSAMFPSLKEVRDSLEQSYFAQQKEVEEKALQLYNTDQVAPLPLSMSHHHSREVTHGTINYCYRRHTYYHVEATNEYAFEAFR